MRSIRFVLVAAVLMTSAFTTPAWATSWSNDQSDLWWNSGESGWGIQFVQRGSTIFATMFVYDAAGNPTWYVATMMGTKVNGVTFIGDLYATHGPYFGAVPFNPAAVTAQKVGTMTWEKQPSTPGTLTYSVNGVNVVKSLTRQPISVDDYSGTYLAGFHIVASACTNPAKNGVIDGAGTLTVTQNGSAISLNLAAGGGTDCTFSGAYMQSGQLGSAAGSYSCIDGELGTFSLSDGYVSPFAMAVRLSLASTTTGCQDIGQLGGIRTDQ